MIKTQEPKQILNELYYSALKAVNGCHAVEQHLISNPIAGKVAVVAVGKAAAAMMLGAKNQLKDQIQSAIVITKEGYGDKSLGYPCIEAGHPVPNEQSLVAGTKLLEFISNIPQKTKLLALISGGASALVEVLPKNMDLELLQKMNKWLLASGLDIHEINKVRQAVSLIKGGGALKYLAQNTMTQFLISDVKMDGAEDIGSIGSGLFVKGEQNISLPKIPDWLEKYIQLPKQTPSVLVESHIIASNEMACQSIIKQSNQEKYEVTYHGQGLYGDVFELAEMLANVLKKAEHGLHIWGGEPTICLPEEPGRGGRNQSLALALACKLEKIKGITVLVGATDGSDGPTDDAGAIIDGLTLQRGGNYQHAKEFPVAADAGTFLADAGDLVSTGPTGTNVMDLVIALKEPISGAS